MSRFEILVLHSLIILLGFAIDVKPGNKAIDLIEDIRLTIKVSK